jgi:hypothetical protein
MSVSWKIVSDLELITNSISRTMKRTSMRIRTGPVSEVVINMGTKLSP